MSLHDYAATHTPPEPPSMPTEAEPEADELTTLRDSIAEALADGEPPASVLRLCVGLFDKGSREAEALAKLADTTTRATPEALPAMLAEVQAQRKAQQRRLKQLDKERKAVEQALNDLNAIEAELNARRLSKTALQAAAVDALTFIGVERVEPSGRPSAALQGLLDKYRRDVSAVGVIYGLTQSVTKLYMQPSAGAVAPLDELAELARIAGECRTIIDA